MMYSHTVSFPRKSAMLTATFLLPLAGIFLALTPQIVLAQQSLRVGGTLEEIVVTAERRESSLQDTPLAVSAFTSNDLDRIGFSDLTDLRSQVPSIHFSEAFTGAITTTLRGIETTSTQAIGDQVVAYHVDGIYVPRPTTVRALQYDLERIEVLRGPQGTLYGRNATAGSINLVSKRPVLEYTEGKADISYGNYNEVQIRAMLNTPISETFGLRFSFLHEQHDGYYDSAGSIDIAGNPLTIDRSDDPASADGRTVRVGALFQPNDDFSWYVSGEYYKSNHLPGFGQRVLPVFDDDPFTVDLIGPTHNDQTARTLRSRIEWGISDSIELSYLAGWGDESIDQGSSSNDPAIEGPLFGIPLIVSATPFDNDYTSHEIQLKSRGDSALSWILGAFYFKEESDNTLCADILIRTPGPLVRTGFCDQRPNTEAESKAAYAQGTYAVNDQLRITAGIRYTDDEKSSVHTRTSYPPPFGKPVSDITVNPGVVPGGFSGPTTEFSDTWTNTSWKLGLDYNVSESSLLYANVTTGYKAGGFAHPPGLPYDQEEITSFELGSKNTLMDGKLNLNGTFYYYDYTDLQVSTVIPDPSNPNNLLAITDNAANAELWGIEVEVQWAVGENGLLFGHASYMDTEYKDFLSVADPILAPGSPPQDLSGNRLPRTPDSEFTFTYQHTFDLGSGATVMPSLSWHYSSSYFTRIYNTDFDSQDSFSTVDANLRYNSPENRFFVELFGRNLTDEIQRTSAGVSPGGRLAISLQPPRTYGVRVGAYFGGEN